MEEIYPIYTWKPREIDVTTNKWYVLSNGMPTMYKEDWPKELKLRIWKVFARPDANNYVSIITDKFTLITYAHKWEYVTSGATTLKTYLDTPNLIVDPRRITYIDDAGSGMIRAWCEIISKYKNVFFSHANEWTCPEIAKSYSSPLIGLGGKLTHYKQERDLGTIYSDVYYVDIVYWADLDPNEWSVEISTDGVTWTTIYGPVTEVGWHRVRADISELRYVRWKIYNPTDYTEEYLFTHYLRWGWTE